MGPVPSRPVLAGNGTAAIHVLDLVQAGWPAGDVLVIAPPDSARHSWQPSLAQAAAERGIRVICPRQVNDSAVITELRSHRADLLLSVHFTQVFGEQFLSSIDGALLNFHPSLLPRHRGTAPLIWAIVEGDSVAGVTAHHLTPRIDAGPIVDQRTLPIHKADTGYVLHMKTAHLVSAMAAGVIRMILAGREVPEGRAQVGVPSYHSKKDQQLNHLDWSNTREQINNIVRALSSPLPGAYSIIGDLTLNIDSVEIFDFVGPCKPNGTVDCGTVPGQLLLWASNGPLLIRECRLADSSVPLEEILGRLGRLPELAQ